MKLLPLAAAAFAVLAFHPASAATDAKGTIEAGRSAAGNPPPSSGRTP